VFFYIKIVNIFSKILFSFLALSVYLWGQEDVVYEDIVQEEIAQEQIVQEGILQEKILQEEIVQEIVVQERIVREKIVQEIVSSSGLQFDSVSSETLEYDEFESRYKEKSNINWPRVIRGFGVGGAVIVMTGVVKVASFFQPELVPVTVFFSFEGALTGCLSGAAIGVMLKKIIETNGDYLSEAADGCMWGAILGAIPWIESLTILKKSKLINALFEIMKKYKMLRTLRNVSKMYKNLSSIFPKAKKIFGKLEDCIPGGFKPNEHLPRLKTIISDGFLYRTDDLGRVAYAAGRLGMKAVCGSKRNNNFTAAVGRKMVGCKGNGGHLIADEFCGTSYKENLVPMPSHVNKGSSLLKGVSYRSVEKTLEKNLKAGKTIYVLIKIIYEGMSDVPSQFEYRYSINGEIERAIVKNKCL